MSTALAEETMPRKDFNQVQLRDVDNGGGLRLALNSFAELEKFSNFMAVSTFVPKHLRGKPADCLAVLLQSMRWNMDPFTVAQKTYFVNDGMAYEAQLVNAIVLARAPLKNRPKITWAGVGEDMTCSVSATFEGEDEPQVFTAEMKTISTRNSPLWKQQPKQQLAYFATRAWARIFFCPDVLMGIYTKDEMEDTSMHIGADNAIDITASSAVVMDMQSQIMAEKEIKPKEKKERAKKAKEAGADPDTGEIKTDKKTVPDAEQRETESVTLDKPEAEQVMPKLDTLEEVKQAATVLIIALEATPPAVRASMFVKMHGPAIVDAIRAHGQGAFIGKIKNLGIGLPE